MRFPTSSLLIGGLLLGSPLLTRPALAQAVLQNGVWIPGRPALPLGYYGEDPMRRFRQPPPTALTDASPALEPVGPLHPEPDTTTQRLFARHRVRAVLRLRLNAEGLVRDTVGYQEIDPQGRWTVATTGSAASARRRQWAYDAQGQCVSRIDAPTQRWPFITMSQFNPATRQGVQKACLSDGSLPELAETQLYRHGDTTLAQTRHHQLTINGQPYGSDLLQRVFTYSPHPDTTLTLQHDYSAKGQLLLTQARYQLRRQGQLLQAGELELRKTGKTSSEAPEGSEVLRQLLQQLRRGQDHRVTHRYFYDRWQRLVRQEVHTPGKGTAMGSSSTVRFTYNAEHQLIGRTESTQAGTASLRPFYTVFSYLPSGLLAGETTNQKHSAPIFYRYQYQYYE